MCYASYISVEIYIGLILNVNSCFFSGTNYQDEGTSPFSGGSEDTQGDGVVPSVPPVPPSGSPVPVNLPTGPSVAQNTSGQHSPHGFPMQPPGSSNRGPPFHGNQPNIVPQMNMQRPIFPPGPELEMLQSLLSCQPLGQNPLDFLSSLLLAQTAGQQGQCILSHCVIVVFLLCF